MLEFPKNFFWGAATSAYQVEGNNHNCDWWEWEKRVGLKENSGLACRHYEFYAQDFDLAQSLSHNCHRLSFEWSRIEPEEGKFSQSEIKHYLDVILALKARGLEPIVTLHHFTNPLWFSHLGGWQSPKATFYFLRYARHIAEAFAGKVHFWVTINEPLVYVYHAYILGVWPPQESSFLKAWRVARNLALAHIRVYRQTHKIYQLKKLPSPCISIAKNLQAFIPSRMNFINKFAAYLRNKIFNFVFLDRLARAKTLDFIGINYYTRALVEAEKWNLANLLLDVCKKNRQALKKNTLGWDVYPEGLSGLLLRLKKYQLPLFILENGICTDEDTMRWDFIREHLKQIYLAMQNNVNVIGYIYWSLLDNFEWDKGFSHRFGLIEVDYQTYQRRVRESAKNFAQVCKTGELA